MQFQKVWVITLSALIWSLSSCTKEPSGEPLVPTTGSDSPTHLDEAISTPENAAAAVFARFVAVHKKAVAVLAKIRDKETAEAARAKLEELSREAESVSDDMRNLPKRPEIANVMDAFVPEFREIGVELDKEFSRIEKAPDLYGPIRGTYFARQREESTRSIAASGVRGLSTAVLRFRSRHGRWPQALEELVKEPPSETGVYTPRESLIDPWGRPIQYDPKGARNGGVHPDIWSLGPPDEPKMVIGNWPKEPKK